MQLHTITSSKPLLAIIAPAQRKYSLNWSVSDHKLKAPITRSISWEFVWYHIRIDRDTSHEHHGPQSHRYTTNEVDERINEKGRVMA